MQRLVASTGRAAVQCCATRRIVMTVWQKTMARRN